LVILSIKQILLFPLLVSYIEIFRKYISTKKTNNGIERFSAIKGIESSVQSKFNFAVKPLGYFSKAPKPKMGCYGIKYNQTEME
jgi:hypothetical protein